MRVWRHRTIETSSYGDTDANRDRYNATEIERQIYRGLRAQMYRDIQRHRAIETSRRRDMAIHICNSIEMQRVRQSQIQRYRGSELNSYRDIETYTDRTMHRCMCIHEFVSEMCHNLARNITLTCYNRTIIKTHRTTAITVIIALRTYGRLPGRTDNDNDTAL